MSAGGDEEQQELEDAEDDTASDGDGAAAGSGDGVAAVSAADAADPKFIALLEKLHTEHNFDFRQYKRASLLRRVRQRMTQVRVDRFDTYMTYLDRHADEHIALLNAVLINVTRFFRDPDAWNVLREGILPRLIESASTTHALRFWSAGCSSGEEAYSLAILVAEILRARRDDYDVKIYATDIDDDALATARAGLYRLDALKEVAPELVDRYFMADGQAFRVRRELRKWCIFGRHDLTQDAPLAHVDVLVCRNVLIYFDSTLQSRIVPRFQYAIRPEGYLFLGRSESMLASSQRFVPVDFKWRIFQRLELNPAEAVSTTIVDTQARAARTTRTDATQLAARIGGILENVPAGIIVIDPAETIVVWNPMAEHMFEVPADNALGRKFRDLDISYRIDGLRARLEEVRTTQMHSQIQDVAFGRRAGDTMHVNVRIAPLYDDRRRLSGVMIAVNDMSTYWQLRDELDRLGEQSATANEELQSTNEELETTNEELQSTNEELETTVEELQSTNTELTALNTELERRTAELRRAEAFELSVLNAVQQAIFVVDPTLVVTHWNAAATQLWDVPMNAAVGREFARLPAARLTRVASEALQRVVATRAPERLTGLPRARPDGDGITLELIPVLAVDGELVGVLGTAVTDRSGDRRTA